MVDTSDLTQVNSIMQLYTNYRQALDVLDDDVAISSFNLIGRRGSAQVSAADIDYPPQMITAVRDQVRRRLEILEDELEDLGVRMNGARR